MDSGNPRSAYHGRELPAASSVTGAPLGVTAVSSSYLLDSALCAWETGLLGLSEILVGHQRPRREKSGDFPPSWVPQLCIPGVTTPSDGPLLGLQLLPGPQSRGWQVLPPFTKFSSNLPAEYAFCSL